MARTRTLGNLRADVRQRADMVSSQFVTDAEVNEYIDQSIADLFDLLVSVRGAEYYEKDAPPIATIGGTSVYALPTDFYQLIRVEAVISGWTVPLMSFTHAEHGALSQYPVQSGQTINVKYVPTPTRLVADGDNFDGFGGWEEFVVVDAAMKCLEKEESDVSALMARKMAISERIQRLATERDGWMPSRRQDVKRAPRTPFALMPRPRYRIRGTASLDGSIAPTIELIQGMLPGSVF